MILFPVYARVIDKSPVESKYNVLARADLPMELSTNVSQYFLMITNLGNYSEEVSRDPIKLPSLWGMCVLAESLLPY